MNEARLTSILTDTTAREKGTNSISLDLEMGVSNTSQYELGESSGVKKKKRNKMRGQVDRNPSWMANEGGVYPTGDTYESLSSYFGMTDLCLGTSSELGLHSSWKDLCSDGVRKTTAVPDGPQGIRLADGYKKEVKDRGCNDEEKIKYATYLLSGPAASWWENVVAVHPPEKVFTWEEFKKNFRDAHVPESVVELKKREFDELQQNTAPIMQYVRDFNRLSRYAPEEVNSDEKRKKRFMKGMNPYMKMQLRLARTAEF
ncbi:hypothetical protein QYE76_052634 [Lolium multiflorum]|uniref:Retrotransposon gag domain-containing protein n=1 Tax=Lolium multiflorum TaxID=4521 RepID=A0AAD8SV37_LOLMU|nr:hypothetical protein QYE76_052634 [Lolium multiflorum]